MTPPMHVKRRLLHRAATGGLFVGLLLLGGCATATSRIGSLLDDPSQYDGRTVRVRGQVTESFGVPIVGGGYRIDDGTGTLTVVSGSSGMPREGAEVEVEGTFHSVFNIGNQSLSVLEEEDREVP